MNNFNNRNNIRSNNEHGGGRHPRRGNRRRTGFSGNDSIGNESGERNFTKFVDMQHGNNDSEYWPQNDWNYNNQHNYNNNFHGNHYPSGGGGIFPWQRKNAVNPLIIPPQVPNFLQTHNEHIPNDKQAEAPTTLQSKGSQQNMQQPSTPTRNSATKSSTPRSRNNSMTANNKNTDNTVPPLAKNVDHKHSPVTKTAVETKRNIKIKEEKKEPKPIQGKQGKKVSSSSSSSSSEDSSSDEEQKPPKKTATIKEPVVKPKPKTGKTSPLIKLKPQLKPATTVKPTTLTETPNLDKTVPTPSSSSSSSSSSDEENPPPPKPAVKQANKPKAKLPIKQEAEEKSAKKKNSSEDDIICMGQLENKIVLEDDDEALDSDSRDETEESTVSKKIVSKSKRATKNSDECMICDKKGHTSFQCQMICKNCSAPYHGFRTCPHPANLNIMLQQFMEFCMHQIQNYNPGNLFTFQNATNSCSETVTQPQAGSSLTSNKTKTNNKLKRKQIKTKELNTKLKPIKKRRLSKIKKRMSEEDDEDDSDNSSPEDDSSDSEDSSSLSESLVAASTKKKLKTSKSKSNSMSAFNLANFMPNPVNLPMVLNGFPSLTGGPTNASTNPNALNTLLLTQMFQNAIGSLKQQ